MGKVAQVHPLGTYLLAAAGIESHIPRRGDPGSNPLGPIRWPIERTLSWLKLLRRLRVRWDRLSAIHEVFLQLAGILIAWRFLID